MNTPAEEAIAHLQALIRCASVTPEEGGALDYMENTLRGAGFQCWRLPFSEVGTPDVDNLFAIIGEGTPHLCFAGHTDVVPPGDPAAWTHPPFGGDIADGAVYGRGAADMKGGIACFLAAALAFMLEGKPRGSISFLITGDEEGPAINGAKKVLDWMAANGFKPDHCLLGEPSNAREIGEAIKIGRRGSFCATLTVKGVQGHVAYPEFFSNPLTGLIAALARLKGEPVDGGSKHFAASNFEVTTIDTGNTATNVVPARCTAHLNIRFNDLQTPETLIRWLHDRIEPAVRGLGLEYELRPGSIASNFYTPPTAWVKTLSAAIHEATGRKPEFSTHGGASDGRFIKDIAPVVEFGLCNATIHKVDEHAPMEHLQTLTDIYGRFLRKYFLGGQPL
ncbi:MAG: succinyl-diaminopimelate desuccinylase [Hyphomicrobiales bacterium]|nr:succinyl-diaminopimelate desuccinylase [Hyphomicrobiales bacterium]